MSYKSFYDAVNITLGYLMVPIANFYFLWFSNRKAGREFLINDLRNKLYLFVDDEGGGGINDTSCTGSFVLPQICAVRLNYIGLIRSRRRYLSRIKTPR